MEHGYTQHLAAMIYSFSKKQHPINMINIMIEEGIWCAVIYNGTLEFCCTHLAFLIALLLAVVIPAQFLQKKTLFISMKNSRKSPSPLLTNWLESLGFADVWSENKEF